MKSPELIAHQYVENWINIYNTGSVDDLLGLYSENAFFVNFEIACGKEAMRPLFLGLTERGWKFIEFEVAHAKEIDSYIHAIIQYKGSRLENGIEDTISGNATHILKKQGNQWLSISHCAT